MRRVREECSLSRRYWFCELAALDPGPASTLALGQYAGNEIVAGIVSRTQPVRSSPLRTGIVLLKYKKCVLR